MADVLGRVQRVCFERDADGHLLLLGTILLVLQGKFWMEQGYSQTYKSEKQIKMLF